MKEIINELGKLTKDNSTMLEIATISREIRNEKHLTPNKKIKDIRLFFNYQIPKSFWYLNRYADIVLYYLQLENFKCPDYDHIYISIADTEKEALENINFSETWYSFSIAILPENLFFKSDHVTKENLILNAIEAGLYDIAILDKLDKNAISKAITQARLVGIFGELPFLVNANSNYRFEISSLSNQNQFNVEVYFSFTNLKTKESYKWKYGEISTFELSARFKKIIFKGTEIFIISSTNGGYETINIDIKKNVDFYKYHL